MRYILVSSSINSLQTTYALNDEGLRSCQNYLDECKHLFLLLVKFSVSYKYDDGSLSVNYNIILSLWIQIL